MTVHPVNPYAATATLVLGYSVTPATATANLKML